jgi:hypothetical protein
VEVFLAVMMVEVDVLAAVMTDVDIFLTLVEVNLAGGDGTGAGKAFVLVVAFELVVGFLRRKGTPSSLESVSAITTLCLGTMGPARTVVDDGPAMSEGLNGVLEDAEECLAAYGRG